MIDKVLVAGLDLRRPPLPLYRTDRWQPRLCVAANDRFGVVERAARMAGRGRVAADLILEI